MSYGGYEGLWAHARRGRQHREGAMKVLETEVDPIDPRRWRTETEEVDRTIAALRRFALHAGALLASQYNGIDSYLQPKTKAALDGMLAALKALEGVGPVFSMSPDQVAYLKGLERAGGEYDPTVVVGGPPKLEPARAEAITDEMVMKALVAYFHGDEDVTDDELLERLRPDMRRALEAAMVARPRPSSIQATVDQGLRHGETPGDPTAEAASIAWDIARANRMRPFVKNAEDRAAEGERADKTVADRGPAAPCGGLTGAEIDRARDAVRDEAGSRLCAWLDVAGRVTDGPDGVRRVCHAEIVTEIGALSGSGVCLCRQVALAVIDVIEVAVPESRVPIMATVQPPPRDGLVVDTEA